ncbi:sensor histidine kinase [Pseudactinotalea sp.]|uniref:sensor histidine kinase n=1 Tax=Pseudactinotalea sp. TaxID=1926260 RepID=UPI003B3BA8F3
MTRWSMYAVFSLEVLFGLILLTGSARYEGAWPLVYVGLICVHAVLAARVFVPAMSSYSGRSTFPRLRLLWLLVATVAACAVAIVGYPGPDSVGTPTAVMLPLVAAVAAVSPLPRRLWHMCAMAVGVMLVGAGVLALVGVPRASVLALMIGGSLAALGVALSCRLSVWTMRVVWELQDARDVAGRLAVAEERLRFSRDLHDVFGRTLSTVAVKSELAAALAERGDPRGPAEMLEVRQLAHDALREVRGVIQGYRSADLDTEIAGARELLRSAGVTCRVAGEGLDLPEPVAAAVAWVVREAVTNVVRHADATHCEIDVRVLEATCRVRISNDGAPAITDPITAGNGLRGLRERLASRGGTFDVTARGGTFVVTAEVPLREDDAP